MRRTVSGDAVRLLALPRWGWYRPIRAPATGPDSSGLRHELGGDERYVQHSLVADDSDPGRMIDQLGDQQPL